MAFTHKKVSIYNIVAKIYQDLGLKDETDIGSLVEWCAEVLGKIGVYTQLEVVDDYKLEIKNYKAELPCDLVYLDDVNYKGMQPDKGASDMIKTRTHHPYYVTPRAVNQDKLENINYFLGKKYRFPSGDTFIIENGWFKTSFKEGHVILSYKAMPVDEQGFPLVPDHESFRDACFWYCAAKYFYIQAIKEDRYRWFYQDAETKWRYYITQAGAEAMMPDVFTLENIKRNFLRLVPKINDYRNSFQNLNNVNG